jgi:hypothetical protein
MPDNKQIKDGLGNLFTLRMRDISAMQDGSLQRSMFYTTAYPIDYGAGGMYKNVAYSGVIAGTLPAASVIYSFRWAAAAMFAIIDKIKLLAWSNTTSFTSIGPCKFETFFARNFTAPDTGGTTLNLASDQNQLRTSMNDSQAVIEVAGTGGLNVGTRTLDNYPLETQLVTAPLNPWSLFNPCPVVLFETLLSEHPIVLNTNEGIEIIASLPPIGNWNFALAVSWAETQNY